jgi:hypothetical protein
MGVGRSQSSAPQLPFAVMRVYTRIATNSSVSAENAATVTRAAYKPGPLLWTGALLAPTASVALLLVNDMRANVGKSYGQLKCEGERVRERKSFA